MKRYFWSISMMLTILLAACGSPTPAAVSPAAPAPVEVVNIQSDGVVISSAVVAPIQVTRLSFYHFRAC